MVQGRKVSSTRFESRPSTRGPERAHLPAPGRPGGCGAETSWVGPERAHLPVPRRPGVCGNLFSTLHYVIDVEMHLSIRIQFMGANKTLKFQSVSLSFRFGVQIYCELKCAFFYESILYYMSHCPLWLNLFSLTTNYTQLITSWPQMIGLVLNSNIFPPVTPCPCRT